jgi:glycosyltransferase involved in cell wall biosynthesis
VDSDETRVLLARGHHPTPWGLGTWEHLPERFRPALLVTGSNRHDLDGVTLERVPVRAVRDLLPPNAAGELAALAVGDRYLLKDRVLDRFDVVHAEDLSLWFTAQLARLRRRHGFKLVVTTWETIPLLRAFRSPHARRYRAHTLMSTDLFLASTERARDALLLEGVPSDRIRVSYPGIELSRFARGPSTAAPAGVHLIVSPGRLEWEKGHHDVLRAVAALRRGLVACPPDVVDGLRVQLIGSGPEEQRLREHAAELGIGALLDIRSVPYDEMPTLFARASCMVLASLPRSGCSLVPGGPPHCFWEEQFGLVLAEAMAAGLQLAVSRSGAIPEVVGEGLGLYFDPGDWMGLARELAAGPLRRPPNERVEYPAERVRRYSVGAAAERIADAYDYVTALR